MKKNFSYVLKASAALWVLMITIQAEETNGFTFLYYAWHNYRSHVTKMAKDRKFAKRRKNKHDLVILAKAVEQHFAEMPEAKYTDPSLYT